MSSALPIKLSCDTVRTVAFGGISGVYAGVGIAFSSPVRIFQLQNLTDTTLMFSYDGVNDHFPLASLGYVIIDVTANQALTQGFFMSQGARLYVRNMVAQGYAVPTIDAVWLTCYVGKV